jgi:2-methylcitrate dehydratase PrpD
LVAFQNLARDALFVIEERVGIQVFIAQIVESRAMHGVGPALDHHAHDAAAVAAVFGRVVALQHAEFGHRIGIGVDHDVIVDQVVVQVAAIEQIRHRIGTPAADAVGSGLPGRIAVLSA